MKKLLLVALLGLGVVGLNATEISKEQFNELTLECLNDENVASCQRVIDSDMLVGVEKCEGANCYAVGRIYVNVENYHQALKYYEKLCKSKDDMSVIACYEVAGFYEEGKGTRLDFAKAKTYYEKACNADINDACVDLGLLYHKGNGVKQNYSTAKKYFEKACNADVTRACVGLGAMYGTGEGVKQNLSTAKQYFGKACDLGEQDICDVYRSLNEQGVK